MNKYSKSRDSQAIKYLAKIHSRANLLGDGSNEQAAEVMSWVSWANQEMLGTLALW